MGILLGDRYIVVGSATSKITFWSESAQTGPKYKPLLGQITCLATQENTGNRISRKNLTTKVISIFLITKSSTQINNHIVLFLKLRTPGHRT
jgi:hypothetical protein